MATRLTFAEHHRFDEMSIDLIRRELTGIYFICLSDLAIPYPIVDSKLIYIGMSESAQHSVARRLRGHHSGQSGNVGIHNYARRHETWFTYLSLEVLSVLGTRDVRELESFFLARFALAHGCYPICNGQAGASFPGSVLRDAAVTVDWDSFK